jgi:hypothetical protein
MGTPEANSSVSKMGQWPLGQVRWDLVKGSKHMDPVFVVYCFLLLLCCSV